MSLTRNRVEMIDYRFLANKREDRVFSGGRRIFVPDEIDDIPNTQSALLCYEMKPNIYFTYPNGKPFSGKFKRNGDWRYVKNGWTHKDDGKAWDLFGTKEPGYALNGELMTFEEFYAHQKDTEFGPKIMAEFLGEH